MPRSIEAGSAFVRLFVKGGELQKGLASAKARLNSFAQTARMAGGAMIGTGAALAAPLALSVRTFANFQDAMAAVGAVTGATESQLGALTDQAKELGRTTSFTATEIAGLQTELGRAGFSSDEILAATSAIQNLGRATGTELPEAAAIAGAALRQFSLPASETTRVADVLTATANNSAQTLQDIGEAMKMVGPVAADAGMSIEQTSKALGVLANLGIKGSLGGTGLRKALLSLSDPAAQAKLAELGVAAVDASGNMRPLADTMIDLGKATASMPNAKRIAFFNEIFGLRAVTTGLKLSSSIEQMDAMSEAIDNAGGAAASTAAKMDDTLGGTFRRIMSAVEGVQIALGESLSSTLANLEPKIVSALSWFTEFVSNNPELIVAIAATSAGLISMGAAMVGLSVVAGGLATAVGLVGTVAGVILTPIGAIAAAIGIASAAVVASALYEMWSDGAFAEIGQEFSDMADHITKSFAGISAAMKQGDFGLAFDIMGVELQIQWKLLLAALEDEWADFVSRLPSHAWAVFKKMPGALQLAVKGGAEALGIADSAIKSALGITEDAIEEAESSLDSLEQRLASLLQQANAPESFVEEIPWNERSQSQQQASDLERWKAEQNANEFGEFDPNASTTLFTPSPEPDLGEFGAFDPNAQTDIANLPETILPPELKKGGISGTFSAAGAMMLGNSNDKISPILQKQLTKTDEMLIAIREIGLFA